MFLGQKLASLKAGIVAMLTPPDSKRSIGVGPEKSLLEPHDAERGLGATYTID